VVRAIATGSRYGPICAELSEQRTVATECPEVKVKITDTKGLTQFTLIVTAGDVPIDELFLQVELSSTPSSFTVR
jgi:hypothetical protein